GRGCDPEREDDPVDSVARGWVRIEKGEAAGGFRGARGSDDDAQGVRSAEPAAGADWRKDLREPAELCGGGGARARSGDHSVAKAGFFRLLLAGGWKCAVRQAFGVPRGSEAITVPLLRRLEVVQRDSGSDCVLRN